jgi:Kelch motif
MMERTFAVLDQLDAPDIRRSVDQRRAGDDDLRPIPKPPGGRRRATAALLALAVFAAAAAFGLRTWTRDQDPQPVSDPWSWAGEGWTRITDPPERHAGATWSWAGGRLFVWGGCTGESTCSPTNEGFVYDPGTRIWRPLPASPRPGHDVLTVADGGHVYLLGRGGEGQVFDVDSNSWAELPAAPIQPDLAVWAGTEIIALQGVDRSGGGTAAAAYDLGTSTWHVLAPPPIEFDVGSVTWSGREVIVVTGLLEQHDRPTPSAVDAMALDPSTETWRTLPGTELYPESFATVWAGASLIAWDYYMRWRSLGLAENAWSVAGKIPLEASECYVSGVALRSAVFAWNCGTASLFQDGVWTKVHGGPVEETISSPTSRGAIKLWRFADLIPAGDVLVLPMTGITLAPSGEPCYGCPGSPESVWVYRPPTGASAPSEAP